MKQEKKKWSQAMTFIVLFGIVSLFSDMTHEGASSIRGAYLSLLGASAATIGFVSGLGELIGYSMRYVFGKLTDKTKHYWPMTILGYILDVLAVPALALVGEHGWIAACALLVLDRFILKLAYIINTAIHADSNPTDTLSTMAYMAYNQRSLFAIGISYTVRLALFGTAIAFVLALLMVFLRIQEPDKRDNDFVKFLKIVANKFSRFYIFVIRGTPMMVQSLILYNAVFGLFKRTGMSVSDINRVWPLFLAGLVTISLNSTAYLAEVLRGGILAVDAGQMEAARSLGMTHWQAMRKVVFPQAIKNSLPAIGNEFIINIKDSSVLCVVGVSDLMFMTRSVAGIYYKGTECYLIAAIVYLFLTYLSSLLLKAITGKMTAPDNTKRHQGNQTVDLGLPSSN